MTEKSTTKDVFNIIEEGEGQERTSKWTRVGSAYVNRDGSINVLLGTFPTEGKLQIRDPRKGRGAASNGKAMNNG